MRLGVYGFPGTVAVIIRREEVLLDSPIKFHADTANVQQRFVVKPVIENVIVAALVVPIAVLISTPEALSQYMLQLVMGVLPV